MSRILVIKHSALGDVVLATGPFKAIREHHKNDHITLLTTRPYAELLRASPYFDEVWIDRRQKLHHLFAFFKLIEKIRQAKFSRVYDLQTSERTGWYFSLMCKPKPEWVGTAKGASHRHETPERTKLHTVERQRQQLAVAGLQPLPKPSLDWLRADISRFNLPTRYALIVPGGAPHRPGKRWPANYYGELCNWFVRNGILPVLIGTLAEAPALSTIEAVCLEARNLLGQTNFAEVAELARGAVCAVGNDTGPMHMAATVGCACLVLFSDLSDPALCAPRGDKVVILREAKLSDLSPQVIEAEVGRLIGMGLLK